MKRRFKNVMTLLDSNTGEQLMLNFLTLNQRRPRFSALLAGMVNVAEQRIECFAVTDASAGYAAFRRQSA